MTSSSARERSSDKFPSTGSPGYPLYVQEIEPIHAKYVGKHPPHSSLPTTGPAVSMLHTVRTQAGKDLPWKGSMRNHMLGATRATGYRPGGKLWLIRTLQCMYCTATAFPRTRKGRRTGRKLPTVGNIRLMQIRGLPLYGNNARMYIYICTHSMFDILVQIVIRVPLCISTTLGT